MRSPALRKCALWLLTAWGAFQVGAWVPEQVINPETFLLRLATRGLLVEFPDSAAPTGSQRAGKAVA